MIDNPFEFVLRDSFSAGEHSTSELEASLWSMLKVLSQTGELPLSPVSANAAYQYVADAFAELGVNQYLRTRYGQLVAGRVSFYSRGY